MPSFFKYKIWVITSFLFLISALIKAQTGSPAEPVRFIGGTHIDPHVHEGRLRYAIGVENRQTLRANRTNPEMADGYGWTYNHASNLCYWNGKYYQQYLSNPVDEHIAPGQTLIATSTDGKTWSKPVVAFPPYDPPKDVEIPEGYDGYMMHQRMGFYVAPNGRLLTLAFYGHTEDPFREGGIGRVVREVYKDGSFGPIYFIRYSSHTNWNDNNTSLPFYKKSTDKGFLEACEALLAEKLMTLQWRDEDKGLDGYYSIDSTGSALSYFHRNDGMVVALWKWSLSALSSDEGNTFSNPVKSPTLVMAGGKVWGQRTKDGRYALSYNPIEQQEYRYPLIIVTGEDGIIFDNMLLVQGEVPPRRFFGRWKDFGPCYVRGIVEGNGDPPGNNLWLTYSMNKEDMWVSRIPLPVRYRINTPVKDDFNNLELNGDIYDWNVYAPVWAPVTVVKAPDSQGNCLQLMDQDPYDYARAIRVFEEGEKVEIKLKVFPGQENQGMLEIDITDQYGNRPVRIKFGENGKLVAMDGSKEKELASYQINKWNELKILIDAKLYGNYDLHLDETEILQGASLAEAVKSVERLSLRTGPYRDLPNRKTPNEDPDLPLPGADEQVPQTLFYIDDVEIEVVK